MAQGAVHLGAACIVPLIETFLWSPRDGFRLLPCHLRRLASSARYFGFRFHREAVTSALDRALRKEASTAPRRIRLLLAKNGEATVEVSTPPPAREGTKPARVVISDVVVSSRDPFVRHKTTVRGWRDDELAKGRSAGFDEVSIS